MELQFTSKFYKNIRECSIFIDDSNAMDVGAEKNIFFIFFPLFSIS